jgi:hypothetical protein
LAADEGNGLLLLTRPTLEDATMPTRANDASRDGRIYEASGLPRGLRINPSTGVIAGVVGLEEGGPDLPCPDAIISDGIPVPSPDPARVTFTALLPPGLSLDSGHGCASGSSRPHTPPPPP